MRRYKTTALCLSMLILPSVAMAQANIKKAFDKFLKNSSVVYTSKHSLDKDPETNKKEGQMDIYEYTIPAKRKDLIKELEKAFEEDKDNAYTIENGTKRNKGSWDVSLAVGDGKTTNVGLGSRKGEHYMYSCFIDPEDETRSYRYAYGMSWLEDGNEITGRLVVTYATTLKYRQQNQDFSSVKVFKDEDFEGSNGDFYNSWLGKFRFYGKRFEDKQKENSDMSSIYADKIYKMCKTFPHMRLTPAEKTIFINELKRLQQLATDEFNKNIFEASLEYLK